MEVHQASTSVPSCNPSSVAGVNVCDLEIAGSSPDSDDDFEPMKKCPSKPACMMRGIWCSHAYL